MNIDKGSMDAMEIDLLSEIGNIGAGNAMTALSKMIDDKVDMRVPKVEMLEFNALAEVVGGADNLVLGILLSLNGDIVGSMLFIMEEKGAHRLIHKLMGQTDHDISEPFNEMELSALLEIGNIISGAYLTAISQMTNLQIIPSVPELALDMAGAILSVPAIEFGMLGDRALLIESQFSDENLDTSGYFILIPTLESYGRILESFGL